MYQNILVAVDSSGTSQRALQEAIRLAKGSGARLCVLHVVEELAAPFMGDGVDVLVDVRELLAAWRRQGEAVLQAAAEAVREAGLDVEVALVESAGERIAKVIDKTAVERGAELIVLGTHGRRGIDHVILGSVADDLVHIASRPVLLVRGT